MKKFLPLFALLLAACASDPQTPSPAPEPVTQTEPQAGSQAEADAVASEAVAEEQTAQPDATQDETPPQADETKTADAGGEPQSHAAASAVLPPAWIFRGDLSTALLPGTLLYEGDRVETGADGRVQLALADGGRLQIGGNAKLTLTRLAPDATASLNGALELSGGVFAFESGHAHKQAGALLPGDLDFVLGKLTAFANQAALIGQSGDKDSTLCLMSGTAEATLPGQDAVTLDTPKSCASTAAATDDKAGTAAQLKALEKNLQAPAGLKAMKSKGAWSLVLVSDSGEAKAKQAAQKLWKSGYPAEVIEAKVKGKTYFRVVLRGYESREAAGSLKKRVAALGYPKAWVNGK